MMTLIATKPYRPPGLKQRPDGWMVAKGGRSFPPGYTWTKKTFSDGTTSTVGTVPAGYVGLGCGYYAHALTPAAERLTRQANVRTSTPTRYEQSLPQSRDRNDPKARIVAHHEAGHAVALMCLGHAATFVTIIPSAEFSGFTGHDDLSPLDTATVCYAGPLAEHALQWGAGTSQFAEPTFTGPSGGDWQEAASLMSEMGVEDRSVAWWRAVAIVDGQWSAITRLADRLLEQGRMSGDEVADVVGRVRHW